jgi:hypothetical protein
VWIDSAAATNSFTTTPVDITIQNGNFTAPVLVDLMTGHIYEIPKRQWARNGTTYSFRDLPLYDAPMLISEKSLVIRK